MINKTSTSMSSKAIALPNERISMNYEFISNVNFKKIIVKLLSAPRTLAVGIVLVLLSSTAMASNKPIPGIDIVVKKKKPPYTSIVATSDSNGQFTLRLVEPGQYTVSSDCKRLKVCPPYKITITATGSILKPSDQGSMAYDFVVENRKPVVLSGVTYQSLDKAMNDNFYIDESENTEIEETLNP